MRTTAEKGPWTCTLLAMAAMGSLFPFMASAEWQVVPGSTLTSGYAGNPRLLREGGENEVVSVAELNALLSGGTERLKVSLAPRATFTKYETEEGLDSNNQFLTATSSLQNERTAWSGTAQLARDSTQISELGTTGLVQNNRRREFVSLGAGPSWRMSETFTTGAKVQWSDVHYVDADFTGLVDYTRRVANVYGILDLSERTQFTVSAQTGWLESAARSSVTRDSGATLGLSRRMGPRWSMDLAAGPSIADFGEATERGYLFSANASRLGDNFQFAFGASRQLDGSGSGVLTQADSVNLNLSRALSERWTLSVGGRYLRSTSVFDAYGFMFQDTRYYGINGAAAWRVSRGWTLQLSADDLAQRGGIGSTFSARGYRVTLGVVWNGATLTL